MREIEVKAKLKDKAGFLKIANKLDIKFSDAIIQEDHTYESDIAYGDPNWNIFRIRKQGNKNILTMKHKASTRSRDNHEYETTIDDHIEITKMLDRLGYKFAVKVNKKRRIAKYRGLEICLDEIEHLGDFVEVEKLAADDADVDSIQLELWGLLCKFGVEPPERVHKGYDTLMYEFIQKIGSESQE